MIIVFHTRVRMYTSISVMEPFAYDLYVNHGNPNVRINGVTQDMIRGAWKSRKLKTETDVETDGGNRNT